MRCSVFAALAVWGLLSSVQAQVSRPQSAGIDFLDERLFIPESERFVEAEYLESGVGLTFGVDKRLSYLAGNYEEAVFRFEEALKRFKYKSEIWVYLARAYFYKKSPEEAKRTLERAAAVMPDLKEQFWDPLLNSLLDEIRKRANDLQIQVDYYSKDQGDFLALFRLYAFLEDYQSAAGVIRAAETRSRQMSRLATSLAGENQRRCWQEAGQWRDLADQLRGELQSSGAAVPVDTTAIPIEVLPAVADQDSELLEQTWLLQLKVDFYSARPEDFRQLFANYLLLQKPDRATEILKAVEREIERIRFQLEIAPSRRQEGQYLAEIEALVKLRDELKRALAAKEGMGEAP